MMPSGQSVCLILLLKQLRTLGAILGARCSDHMTQKEGSVLSSTPNQGLALSLARFKLEALCTWHDFGGFGARQLVYR
jgi:hypothetical protein